MTVKELKEKILNFPDDAVVRIEGRWGEIFDVHDAELDSDFDHPKQKFLYLS